jgi:hypothetical protein
MGMKKIISNMKLSLLIGLIIFIYLDHKNCVFASQKDVKVIKSQKVVRIYLIKFMKLEKEKFKKSYL